MPAWSSAHSRAAVAANALSVATNTSVLVVLPQASCLALAQRRATARKSAGVCRLPAPSGGLETREAMRRVEQTRN